MLGGDLVLVHREPGIILNSGDQKIVGVAISEKVILTFRTLYCGHSGIQ